jgi:hypothetical protein
VNDRRHAVDLPVVAAPRVCRLLRTKTAFGQVGPGAPWKLGHSTTAAYWCLATMEPFGPDEAYCHPHVCGEGRACFRPDAADPLT